VNSLDDGDFGALARECRESNPHWDFWVGVIGRGGVGVVNCRLKLILKF